MIATTVKHDHGGWADNLAAIGCSIRTSRHETTGYTPFNFKREHKLLGSEFDHPIPASDDNPDSTTRKRLVGFRKRYQNIAAKLKTSHERDKRVYDLRRRQGNTWWANKFGVKTKACRMRSPTTAPN
jgi:hypothetical protein